jgi:hypothetical protein
MNNCVFTGNSGPGDGGGVLVGVNTNFAMDSCWLDSNETTTGRGGGLEIRGSGSVSITRSTFSNNKADGYAGGAIALGDPRTSSDTSTLINDTLVGNQSGDKGGGLFDNSADNLYVYDSTINNNSTGNGGGGIFVGSQGVTLTLANSIVYGNTDTSNTAPDIAKKALANFDLIGSTLGLTLQHGSGNNIIGQDPLLGPLTNTNGGPVPTEALQTGSPALNAGDPIQLGMPDQRGVVRSGGVNSGAFQASATTFVVALYQELLGRAVSAGDLSDGSFQGWVNEVNAGVPREKVVAQFETAPEFLMVQVNNLYLDYLHRPADALGLKNEVNFLNNGGTPEGVAAHLVGSAEFLQDAGGSQQAALHALYLDALNRDIDPTGLADALNALAAGLTLERVAATLFRSDEYRRDLVMGYYDLLGRAADPGGLNNALALLRAGGTDAEVIAGLLGSDEFFNRS